MEYCICQARNADELSAMVAARVALGWRPAGGVTFNPASPFDDRAHQAMTHEEPAPPAPVRIVIEDHRCWWCRLFSPRERVVELRG